MLDLLNVKYVLTDPDVPIESPKYKLVYDAEVKVYENLGVLPRAFTMPIGCETVTDDPLDGAEAARSAHDGDPRCVQNWIPACRTRTPQSADACAAGMTRRVR